MSADLRQEYLDLLKLTLTGLADVVPTGMKRAPRRSVELVPLSNLDDRREGRDWPANGYTMVGLDRLNNLQACIEEVLADDVPGDLIETGVWRGGASMFMRAVLKTHGVTDRTVFLADSFEGLPDPDTAQYPADENERLHLWEYLAVPQEAVEENFRRLGLMDDQVRFVKGWFRDTMPTLAGHTWAVIRLDGDMYESTIQVLESLYPGLSPGGFVIVDDYFRPNCRKAVDDYRDAHGIADEVHAIDWGSAYWRKRADETGS